MPLRVLLPAAQVVSSGETEGRGSLINNGLFNRYDVDVRTSSTLMPRSSAMSGSAAMNSLNPIRLAPCARESLRSSLTQF